MSWKTRPVFIDTWPNNDIEYAIFVDENGDPSLNQIINAEKAGKSVSDPEQHLAVTACCVHRPSVAGIKKEILALKKRHWPEGLYAYDGITPNRVCFHSDEIRKRKGPFAAPVVNRDAFLQELTDLLIASDYNIISCCINKLELYRKYARPYNPYSLGITFLLERITKNFVPPNAKCIVVIEARNPDQDRYLLSTIVDILSHGTKYATSEQLSSIQGVYFNRKWCAKANDLKTYFCLEIADLVGYPAFKYFVHGHKDTAFQSIERKVIGYPDKMHYGLKKFPQK